MHLPDEEEYEKLKEIRRVIREEMAAKVAEILGEVGVYAKDYTFTYAEGRLWALRKDGQLYSYMIEVGTWQSETTAPIRMSEE